MISHGTSLQHKLGENTTRDGVLLTHKNVGKSEKIVGEGYADVFLEVGTYVGKTESREAFPTRERHGVGNASPGVMCPDTLDDVGNTSLDAVFCDETTGVENTSLDVFFADTYRSVGNDIFRRFCTSYYRRFVASRIPFYMYFF
uniref:CACTA en-spm transposon protein n=1 Tax=Cucumis melo TaxID=3656 RepID=A0A9I9DLE0_CUCME